MARLVAEAITSGVAPVPTPVPEGNATGNPTETVLLDLVNVDEVVDGAATRICVTTSDPAGLMSGRPVEVGFGMSGKGPPPDWVAAMMGK